MRTNKKGPEPEILAANKERWTAECLADRSSDTKRYRYRHPEIKEALKNETYVKCVYCESKIGHNTPGDVEHKIPTSVDPTQNFEWNNLTIACTECNRRKSNYFSRAKPFLDPYAAGVEGRVRHYGPVMGWPPADGESEVTIKTLALDTVDRAELLSRKVEKIEALNNLVARLTAEQGIVADVLRVSLLRMRGHDAEYSGMIDEICKQYQIA
jgi:DNA-directed RNA polymerase subunit RPC12/RpoP